MGMTSTSIRPMKHMGVAYQLFQVVVVVICAVFIPMAAMAAESSGGGKRVLLIVLDGLRPDYVKPDLMPNLYALGERGVVCTDHHSTFPTVTRVNASSIVTGAYPQRHGILANTNPRLPRGDTRSRRRARRAALRSCLQFALLDGP